jgi:hypothetical protein
MVENLLDRGAVDQWREEDAATKAENKRRTAYRADLRRSLMKGSKGRSKSEDGPDDASAKLAGWDELERHGLSMPREFSPEVGSPAISVQFRFR